MKKIFVLALVVSFLVTVPALAAGNFRHGTVAEQKVEFEHQPMVPTLPSQQREVQWPWRYTAKQLFAFHKTGKWPVAKKATAPDRRIARR